MTTLRKVSFFCGWLACNTTVIALIQCDKMPCTFGGGNRSNTAPLQARMCSVFIEQHFEQALLITYLCLTPIQAHNQKNNNHKTLIDETVM